MQSSSEQLMAIGAEGGIEDSLSSRRECLEDMIEVLHGGFLLVFVSSHYESCWPGPPCIERSRVKVCP
jgi:hypothetical protein